MKRVLVVLYSQSGQLSDVARQMIAPLQADARINVHIETLRPRVPYPFPWPFFSFFDAFPESAHLIGPPLEPLSLSGEEDFDLIILPWQVWFLAPSLPVTAFLQHRLAKQLLRGKPVVSVIACRNMWLFAHEKMLVLLGSVGARLIDNVVLTDPGPTLATFITTPRWVLTGRKDAFWGLPAAGLSEHQVRGARRFGLALRDALAQGRERGDQPLLAGLAAVAADARLYVSEQAGTRSFHLWGKLLRAAGPPGAARRRPLLLLYVVFLIVIIITIVPASLALQWLLRPFMQHRLTTIAARFEAPSGSGRQRMGEYDERSFPDADGSVSAVRAGRQR